MSIIVTVLICLSLYIALKISIWHLDNKIDRLRNTMDSRLPKQKIKPLEECMNEFVKDECHRCNECGRFNNEKS